MDSGRLKTTLWFMKYRLGRRGAIPFYRELVRNQYLSPDELDALNWMKRKALLSYAYEKVPYYRKKYIAAGLHPSDIRSPDDYATVPLLTKEELRHNFNDFISEDAIPGCMGTSATGGSTGIPVKVMFDKRVPLEAYGWRMLDWWGINPGIDGAFVWRSLRTTRMANLFYSCALWPTRRLFLDASCMTAEAIDHFLAAFNRLRPPLLQGYVGAIYEVASHIEDRGLRVHFPKAIWVTSSPVSSVQRQRIEAVFNGPVYDQYGCGEMTWLAAQCRQKMALHMFHDGRYIEFVDETGRGQPCGHPGKIVLTNLNDYSFPVIRYANGDVGRSIPGICPCGVTLPLMDKVSGRVSDSVRLPQGASISGDYLTTIFDDYPEVIKAFQVRQASDYSIRVLYVPDSNTGSLQGVLERVNGALMKRTLSQVPISFEPVSAIPHDRGKLRFVISDVC